MDKAIINSATAQSSPEDCYHKLEKLKDIRQKTLQIEKLKVLVKETLHAAEEEKHSLGKYKHEVSLLLQEKMAHVEELRLIHTDINTMENLIKHSTMERNNRLNEITSHFEKFKPLKAELDSLRKDIGLPASEGLNIDEMDLAKEAFGEKETTSNTVDKPAAATGDTFVTNEVPDKIHIAPPDSSSSSHPPPMKLCGSCHQFIHRNAPICPLCKAKSRSRNPKKQKKVARAEE